MYVDISRTFAIAEYDYAQPLDAEGGSHVNGLGDTASIQSIIKRSDCNSFGFCTSKYHRQVLAYYLNYNVLLIMVSSERTSLCRI